MIIDKIKPDRKNYAIYSHHSSQLGHPCNRYLVHRILDWEKREEPCEDLQWIFWEGEKHHKLLLQDIVNAGIDIVEVEKTYNWKKYNISGKIDIVAKINDILYILELKSMSDWSWNSIKTIEDVKNNEEYYIRNYYTQIQIYMLLLEIEKGLLILKNKQTGRLKEFEINLDYDFCESIIEKVERLNQYIEKKEYPERLNDATVCFDCEFKNICLPDLIQKEIDIDINILDELLLKIEELKKIMLPYEEELQKLESVKKQVLTGKDKILTPHFLITGKQVNMPERVSKAYSYWRINVKRLGQEE